MSVSPPTVVVNDDQLDHPIDTERWATLANAVLDDQGIEGPAELVVTFVDEPTITTLNETHMQAEGSTDVLSFPLDLDDPPLPGTPRLLGDIMICPEVAARNAPDHAGTHDDEIALLLVHGILHVLGHDHGEHDEAVVMRDLEAALLTRHHRSVAVGTEIPGGETPR